MLFYLLTFYHPVLPSPLHVAVFIIYSCVFVYLPWLCGAKTILSAISQPQPGCLYISLLLPCIIAGYHSTYHGIFILPCIFSPFILFFVFGIPFLRIHPNRARLSFASSVFTYTILFSWRCVVWTFSTLSYWLLLYGLCPHCGGFFYHRHSTTYYYYSLSDSICITILFLLYIFYISFCRFYYLQATWPGDSLRTVPQHLMCLYLVTTFSLPTCRIDMILDSYRSYSILAFSQLFPLLQLPLLCLVL